MPFDPILPTLKDAARLYMGDVAGGVDEILPDDVYEALLGPDDDPHPPTQAYVSLARSLAAVCNQKALTVEQGSVKLTWGERGRFYADMAARLGREGIPDDLRFVSPGTAKAGRIDGPDIHRMNRLNGVGYDDHFAFRRVFP